MKRLIAGCLVLSSVLALSQPNQTVRLMFVGDVMGHMHQIRSAFDSASGKYDYTAVFSELKPLFDNANYVIANLEVTLAGEPYSGYPQFSSPDELVDGLRAAGVNVLVTANNHSVDRGGVGLQRTIEVIRSRGILCTGTFTDSTDFNERNPLILERNGIKLALLNYTYGTNGISVPIPYMVNLIDTLAMSSDINKAISMGVDDIIVFIHWGNEYERMPNALQKKLTKWLHGKDVRIIIGSHPHVVQQSELSIRENDFRMVVYSLGNFVSNQRKRYCDGGVIAYLELTKTPEGRLTVSGNGYIPVWVHLHYHDGKSRYNVFPVSTYESISSKVFTPKNDSLFRFFVDDTRKLLDQNNVNFPEIRCSDGQWLFPTSVDN